MIDAITVFRCVLVGCCIDPTLATRQLNIVVSTMLRTQRGTRPTRSVVKIAMTHAIKPASVTIILYVNVLDPRPMDL